MTDPIKPEPGLTVPNTHEKATRAVEKYGYECLVAGIEIGLLVAERAADFFPAEIPRGANAQEYLAKCKSFAMAEITKARKELAK